MKDLLSGDFTENVNLIILKRIRILSKAVLILSLIYSVVEIINWGIIVNNSVNNLPLTFKAFYLYRILPLIFLAVITINIFGYTFNVKAASLIVKAFEHKDAEIFNNGFSLVYKTAILAITSFCIAIISAIIRLFLN